MSQNAKIEFGDFQTPVNLARDICRFLVQKQIHPDVVVEPTCGIGSFLVAAAESFPDASLLGWDINTDYVTRAKSALAEKNASARSSVSNEDFFKLDWGTEFAAINGDLLILGNLPWVTNATVSSLNGGNLPTKENFQGFRGIEARTGKSNFDISEWMLIQILKALRGRKCTIAMLCKTATARKFLRYGWKNNGLISQASLHKIDAKKQFGASVDACLLFLNIGASGSPEAQVFQDLNGQNPVNVLGLVGDELVFDIQAYQKQKRFDGLCPYQWRSGVKHDCASVMELCQGGGDILQNKLGEEIRLESEYLFPLLKCSDLANGRNTSKRLILITQRHVGEDTGQIARKAPQTWSYLNSHKDLFDGRKSSIYLNRTQFALFGIGDYSFAPWKVAISGLHKHPRFILVEPMDDKPILFDDTCYFLPFYSRAEAEITAKILNSSSCLSFISTLMFEDSKRPVTVELLERINLHAVAEEIGLADEWTQVRNNPQFDSKYKSEFQTEFIMERPVHNHR